MAEIVIPIVGIVGGIGSGKSTLARWVAEHHPVVVIDADRIGHALLLDPNVKAALRSEFGDTIFDREGNVIRAELAQRVFGTTTERRSARKRLDELLHPRIQQEIGRQIAAIGPQKIRFILLDAALLLESGWRDQCCGVVFVDTPDERRAEWVQQNRGWSLEELQRREASQWPLDKKRAAADLIVPNTADIPTSATALWEGIQQFL